MPLATQPWEIREALLVDMLPRGADSMVEIFRAVLCESDMAKLQEKDFLGKSCEVFDLAVAVAVACVRGAGNPKAERKSPRPTSSSPARFFDSSAFYDFAQFARQQMDLQHEVRLLQQIRSSLSTLEVALVTWEEGVCLSEVIRRPFTASSMEHIPQPVGIWDSEIAARMTAAKMLVPTSAGRG
ncbi:hypothetical protein AK812_SmicGene36674 [Symbiodinium microadriaticum]|uniref:Uncharacterized protein n=1 Tax=Symbiodinium microadriaticum TaxID=2951 RepID=A0A1Q9CIB0_SYMMI|nr:hypothetical protein AK812_SmicGene36674 [Symbiodinium microadriaticum]